MQRRTLAELKQLILEDTRREREQLAEERRRDRAQQDRRAQAFGGLDDFFKRQSERVARRTDRSVERVREKQAALNKRIERQKPSQDESGEGMKDQAAFDVAPLAADEAIATDGQHTVRAKSGPVTYDNVIVRR